MKTDITCEHCKQTTAVRDGVPLVCDACGRPLDVTIDLDERSIGASKTDDRAARTVLIVDDEADVRTAVRTVLRGHGLAIVGEASNGPDAALLAAEHQPSVVILDQRMPAMTGEHTAKLLRRVSPGSLIVVFSALVDRRPDWADAAVRKDDPIALGEVVTSVTRPQAPAGP